jgi:SAM-dependent methyltransferase
VTASEELVAFVGHRVHLVRSREVPTLLKWLGRDLAGDRVLDVGGGDGYWAGLLRKRGATVVGLDIDRDKLERGSRLKDAPELVEGDALALPFPDDSFDAVLSVCALEHFPDPKIAIEEMARVMRPGGRLVISVDALTRADRYPKLAAHYAERYHVRQTFRRDTFTEQLEASGLKVSRATYLFRRANQTLFLAAAKLRPKWTWNALAPLAPFTAVLDRFSDDDSGAILLVDATKPVARPQGSAS